jgi:hypothetical protein
MLGIVKIVVYELVKAVAAAVSWISGHAIPIDAGAVLILLLALLSGGTAAGTGIHCAVPTVRKSGTARKTHLTPDRDSPPDNNAHRVGALEITNDSIQGRSSMEQEHPRDSGRRGQGQKGRVWISDEGRRAARRSMWAQAAVAAGYGGRHCCFEGRAHHVAVNIEYSVWRLAFLATFHDNDNELDSCDSGECGTCNTCAAAVTVPAARGVFDLCRVWSTQSLPPIVRSYPHQVRGFWGVQQGVNRSDGRCAVPARCDASTAAEALAGRHREYQFDLTDLVLPGACIDSSEVVNLLKRWSAVSWAPVTTAQPTMLTDLVAAAARQTMRRRQIWPEAEIELRAAGAPPPGDFAAALNEQS